MEAALYFSGIRLHHRIRLNILTSMSAGIARNSRDDILSGPGDVASLNRHLVISSMDIGDQICSRGRSEGGNAVTVRLEDLPPKGLHNCSNGHVRDHVTFNN